MIARIKENLVGCWKTLLVTDLLFKLIAYVLFFPAVGILFRLFVLASGRSLLVDADIARFFLGPFGWVCMIVVGGAVVAVYALEHAVLLCICLARDRRVPAPATAALRFVLPKCGPVMQLTGRVVGRLLIRLLPFLAAGGLVYWWLLTEKDINFYLQIQPWEFWLATALLAVLVAAAGVVAIGRLLDWAIAVPILLLENRSPVDSLGESEARLLGRKTGLAKGITAWLAVHAITQWAASFAIVWMSYQVAPWVVDSFFSFVALTGGLVLTVTVVNYLVQWFAGVTLASGLALLYRDVSVDGSWQPPSVRWLDRLIESRWNPVRVIAGLALAVVISTAVAMTAVESVRWDDQVQIVAHRGGGALGPENTLAAIEASIAAGADWIEIDVQESRDGVVVVVHDSDLAKVSGKPIKIWETTAKSLRSVDIGSYFGEAFADQRVPTLDEVLGLCKDRVKVNIELKYYGHNQELERKVAESVDRFGMASDVVVMSLKLAGAQRMKELRPEWQVGLLTAVAMGDLTRLDVDFLAVNHKLATHRLIARAHAREKWVAAWTVNQPAQVSELAGRDLDQIITDDPAMAHAVLRWRAELSPLERLAIELAHYLRIQPHALYQRDSRQSHRDRSN